MAADSGNDKPKPEPTVEEIDPKDLKGKFIARNVETGRAAIIEIDNDTDPDSGRIRTFFRKRGEIGGHN